MRARRALLAGACLAAAGGAWLFRGDDSPSTPDTAAPAHGLAAHSEPRPGAADTAPPHEPAALARIAKLRAMSDAYRNTTFVAAIRSAGFLCYELGTVYGGVNDSTTWTVTCADMLAYTVRVDGGGKLVVEPMLQYWDGVPLPVQRDERARRDLVPPLPR